MKFIYVPWTSNRSRLDAEASITLTGLTEDTDYDVYCFAEDWGWPNEPYCRGLVKDSPRGQTFEAWSFGPTRLKSTFRDEHETVCVLEISECSGGIENWSA